MAKFFSMALLVIRFVFAMVAQSYAISKDNVARGDVSDIVKGAVGDVAKTADNVLVGAGRGRRHSHGGGHGGGLLGGLF